MTLHEQREFIKVSLATFCHYEYNRFDAAADQAISQLRKENKKSSNDNTEMDLLKKDNFERCKELQELADRVDINLDKQLNSHLIDNFYREEEIAALFEMKIIYAYKHLEVNIKKLISTAYSNANIGHFYKWDALLSFLKSKMIDPRELSCFKEVNELREVNNVIKHKETFHKELQHVKEFKGQNYLSLESLEQFYSRVNESPFSFLSSLCSAIYSELYEFNDYKIKEMTESIVLRMDKEQAVSLANLILSYYK